MSRQIYISGRFFPQEDAKISVFDHGLLYGDGVFEGLRSYRGKVFRLDEHIRRLYESAKAIWLEIPMSPDEMCDAVNESVRTNKIEEAIFGSSLHVARARSGSIRIVAAIRRLSSLPTPSRFTQRSSTRKD